MKSKKKLLKTWKIYPILDNGMFPEKGRFTAKFYELLDSPSDVIQLRLKDLNDESIFPAVKKMAAEARKRNIPVIMNDRPEMALVLGCSGVHLGKGDIPASLARKMLGPRAIIGRTIRNKKDLSSARASDYDYVSIGPVFHSPVKSGLRRISFSVIREVRRAAKKPVVAIGGINKNNAAKVMAQGAQAVAFMRYAVSEKNTKQKIKELRKILEE